MTATLNRTTVVTSLPTGPDSPGPARSVMVCATSTSQPGSFRITFTRTDRPTDTVVFHSAGEVAMALNLSGQPVTATLPPAAATALVLLALDRVGMDRILDADLIHRACNVLRNHLHPQAQARQRAVWTPRRAGACTDAADHLCQVARTRVLVEMSA